MSYYPATFPVPEGLTTPRLALRMLRASDVVLDYQAVMASRKRLLYRSAGRWPRFGFTLAENLADLKAHEREHRAREAFTFTVMQPDGRRCLGCLYMEPLAWLGVQPGQFQALSAPVSGANFWLRPEATGAGLDRHLLDALGIWFREAWGFGEVLLGANDGEQRNLQLFAAAGLTRVLKLSGRRDRRWSLFRA